MLELPLSRKVNFVIAGTQKGGTTALATYLRAHAAICMTEIKEAHYFDREQYFDVGKAGRLHYHSLFKPSLTHEIIGEVTPIYMYWYDAPRRIWEYNSEIKIIIILRNPIERAYSNWNMERHRNRENLPFWDAIQSEQVRCQKALPQQHRIYSYVDRGFYSDQIRRIWAYFPKKQTLILKNEMLRNSAQETLDKVCSFLGINNLKTIKALDVHSRPYVSTITDREKDYLRETYEYGIKDLERILNWDCSDWLR